TPPAPEQAGSEGTTPGVPAPDAAPESPAPEDGSSFLDHWETEPDGGPEPAWYKEAPKTPPRYADGLPDALSLDRCRVLTPRQPEELIAGVLRMGHKMLLAGSSKAGKSFLLMELCIAIAEGREWLGFPCRQGRVLYVNLEIDPASAVNRFTRIYRALGIPQDNAFNILMWNLRGHAKPIDRLAAPLIRRLLDGRCDAVVIDPIYKVLTGDENSAAEMSAFCNFLDAVCEQTGCAVIYCHHHSKGDQSGKRITDRASGSGVFARDPDAQLDIIELAPDEIQRRAAKPDATAWLMESSLREFPNIAPLDFWFEYPLHRRDLTGALADASPPKRK
ncbi:MAG: AAA family ATPase, partial [Clostridia bacterium]|nr:AAA family ATPase [Clostridia bacterium]